MKALSAVFVIFGVVSAAPQAFGQVPGSLSVPTVQQPDLMATLLAEVQALRAEVREAARTSARSQLLVARVQLQQAQLTRLDQHLALASARRRDAARDRMAAAAQLRELDRRRTEQLFADERSAIDADRRQLRTQVQEQQSLEAQYHRQETELSEALSAEEERLRELTARLDALDLR